MLLLTTQSSFQFHIKMKLKKLSDVKKVSVPERVKQTLDAMKAYEAQHA